MTDGDDTPHEDHLILLANNERDERRNMFAISAKRSEMIAHNAQGEEPIFTPPALEEMMVEQALEEYYKSALLTVGRAGSKFLTNQRKL